MTIAKTALIATLALALSGCAYDYFQHTDRVSYKSGDAVKANLEAATVDPSNASKYKTSGLGKNGNVTTNSNDAGPPPGTP